MDNYTKLCLYEAYEAKQRTKKRIALIAVIAVCVITITIIFIGCQKNDVEVTEPESTTEQYTPFECFRNDFNTVFNGTLLHDKETNKLYLVNSNGNCENMLMLVRADGSPKLYKGDIETADDIFEFLPNSSYSIDFFYDKQEKVIYSCVAGNFELMTNDDGSPRLYNEDGGNLDENIN